MTRHICVLPFGGLSPETFTPWSVSDLAPYVHYEVQPYDSEPLFEGFIFSGLGSRPGRFMYPMYVAYGSMADQRDWLCWIDTLFAPGCNWEALSILADRPLEVWVSIPYPHMRQTNFGKVKGKALNFQIAEDRYEAVEWWISRFLERLNQQGEGSKNLVFRGFLWQRESIDKNDEPLVKQTNQLIASLGYHSIWLPHYGGYGSLRHKMLGFDDAAIHSNYYGNAGFGVEWIDHAATMAKTCGAGFQIICGKGILYNDSHFLDYLNHGLPEKNGYMSDQLLVYQFPNQRLRAILETRPEFYDRLQTFIKGTYLKVTYPGITY